MITKEVIGHNIRKIRDEQHLTREQVCVDETRLTVRQLMRIENGQSYPSVEKLVYLSEMLGVTIFDLIGEHVPLPKGYLDAKYQLIKHPSYGELTRIHQKSLVLETIYDKYYSDLPEEELLFLDIIERMWYLMTTNTVDMTVDVVYDDYFAQVLAKAIYNINDLCLIKFYIMQHYIDLKETEDLGRFHKVLLEQEIQGDEIYNVELLSALGSLAGFYIQVKAYKKLPEILNRIDYVIQESSQLFYKPLLLALRAKYAVYVEVQTEKAEHLYETAYQLANSLGDSVVIQMISREREKDLPKN